MTFQLYNFYWSDFSTKVFSLKSIQFSFVRLVSCDEDVRTGENSWCSADQKLRNHIKR